MKVFKITPIDEYTGGSSLIAANNKKEAIDLFKKDERTLHDCISFKFVCNEVFELEANVDASKIIFSEIYVE